MRTLEDSLDALQWSNEGSVYLLVAKPAPGVHEVVSSVHVSVGIGFDTDHERKAFYRGVEMTGRQVSAITSEYCVAVGVDPVDVGDNIVMRETICGACVREIKFESVAH